MTGRMSSSQRGDNLPGYAVSAQNTADLIGPCLDLDTISDLAEGLLTHAQAIRARAHLRRCADCAAIGADVARLSARTRRLHADWLGFLGAWTYSGRNLSVQDDSYRAWAEHLSRCRRCRNRQRVLAALMSPAPYAPLVSFAAGVAACMLFAAVFHPAGIGTKPHGRFSAPVAGPSTLAPKYIQPAISPSIAQDMLDHFLRPSAAQLPAVIGYWEREQAADQTDLSVHTKLAELYRYASEIEKNPAKRSAWQRRYNREEAWIKQHR